MQIKLEFTERQVFMTVPPCKFDDPLHRAFMGGYPATVLDIWNVLSEEHPSRVELPVTAWRHFLRVLTRGYEFAATYKKPADTVVDPLVYVVEGVEYANEKAIPQRPDFVHAVGAFTLTQPELIAIDPCYDNVAREAVSMTALTGSWRAQATLRDELNGWSCALLAVAHESVTDNLFDASLYESEPVGVAGVDSGMCGFFDRSAYPDDEAQHEHEDGTFYKGCCDATDCKADYRDNTRVLPMDIVPGAVGVNSRTFIGDGGYRCFVRKNEQGLVIAACLVFDYGDKVFGDDSDDDN